MRIEKMEHFFGSVAQLMANLVRYTVENSLFDLVDLLEDYLDGNQYQGQYGIYQGLALPTKFHPVKFFLVSIRSLIVSDCLIFVPGISSE